jgi:TonB family protein
MLEKPTLYSISGSIAFHLVCALVAGNYLFTNTRPVPVKKIYRLEVIKKKPPIEKKKIEVKKKKKRKKIPKPLKPIKQFKPIMKQEPIVVTKVMPVPVPQIRPKTTEPLPNITPVTKYTSRPMTTNAVTSIPRRVQPVYQNTTSNAVASVQATSYSSKSARKVRVASVAPLVSSKPMPTSTGSARTVVASKSRAQRVAIPQGGPQKIGKIDEGEKGPGKIALVETKRARAFSIPSNAPTSPKVFDAPSSDGVSVAYFESVGQRILIASLDPRVVPNFTDEGALRTYKARLGRIIARVKKYPNLSRAKREVGQVVVRFNILRNGEIEKLGWITKSPYERLNNEALDAVRRSAPFAELPPEIPGAFLEIELPFKFQLN